VLQVGDLMFLGFGRLCGQDRGSFESNLQHAAPQYWCKVHLQARTVLKELQRSIKANSGYVLGSFTYADIVMAVSGCSLLLLIARTDELCESPDTQFCCLIP
jgi:hypothetical protein